MCSLLYTLLCVLIPHTIMRALRQGELLIEVRGCVLRWRLICLLTAPTARFAHWKGLKNARATIIAVVFFGLSASSLEVKTNNHKLWTCRARSLHTRHRCGWWMTLQSLHMHGTGVQIV